MSLSFYSCQANQPFVWWTATTAARVEWRCSTELFGGQCVMMTGTCTTPTWCVSSLAADQLVQPRPRPTLGTDLVQSCWTMWNVAAMKWSCRCASTWAGVNITAAIMKMLELSVNVRPDFKLCGVKAPLNIRLYTLYNTEHRESIYQRTSINVISSSKSSHFHSVQSSVLLRWVAFWGEGSPESIKNTVHESRHISLTACLQAKYPTTFTLIVQYD